ncbi:AAC(3) family N-acetyltransferase [bacterium]|nr:AAC(3) family N-acetyltransferase [bacterium]
MENIVLFKSRIGDVTKKDFYDALIKIGAHDCKYLFIHSSLSFGMPNPELSKKELLGHIINAIMALNVENILMPTFTFSFCNREDFDVQNTKSAMGILTEYFRKMDGVRRSVDPMMSVAMIGKDYSVIDDIANNSCGENCTFDLLHKKGGCKFLFLGNRMSDCMTYTHYVEVVEKVPYRYAKEFKGNIINNGISEEKTFFLDVRYKDIETFYDRRIDDLVLQNGEGKTILLGDTQICIANEVGVYKHLRQAIKEDPLFMLSKSLPEKYDNFYVYEKKVAL